MNRHAVRLLDALADLLPLAIGAGTSLVLLVVGAGALTTILVGFAVAASLQLFSHVASLGKRSECEIIVAAAARSILDRHLVLTRIDAVGRGDYLTLRHFSAAAGAGRLEQLVGFGGPAHTLAQSIEELVAEIENEVSRCYVHLRGRDRAKVDAFAGALRRAAAAAAEMLHAPLGEPSGSDVATDQLFRELGGALRWVETTGDELDRTFDPKGHRVATEARATSEAEQQRREGHAAAVLLRSARDAAQEMQLPSVQHQVPIVELVELRERLTRACEHMQNVDPAAFGEATDDARHTHRRIRYGDLGEALEAAQRLAADPSDPDADAVLRHRLDRLPADLAELEAVCDGRMRDVRPWLGVPDPGAPTVRPQ